MRRLALTTALAALTFLLAGAAHAASRPAAPFQPAKPDALSRALDRGELTAAQYALQRALSVFRYDQVRARFGHVVRPAPREATLLLRDLALREHELSGSDRALAEALLSRPNDPRFARPDDNQDPTGQHYSAEALADYWGACTDVFCVNYVKTGADAPALDDTDGNGTPDYVDLVGATLQQVWGEEITTLGFRAPKSDANTTANPYNLDGRLDVYLVDLHGDQSGLYGYCSTDDPNISPDYPGFDLSAFCVFDNDYSPSEYPQSAPLAALQATVAHEFAHASQFAYNYSQDRWFMEATATWMEEQVFDDVNDNVQYVPAGALMNPDVPLDLNAYDGDLSMVKYGNWVFFQFLSENLGPELVRRAWEQSDGVPGGPALFATYALDAALMGRGSDLAEAFANFGAASVWPPAFFEEGSSWVFGDSQQFQAAAPVPRPVQLSPHKRRVGARALVLDHLTTGYAAFAPGKGTRKAARLQVAVDLPNLEAGSRATIVTLGKDGRVGVYAVALNAAGKGSRTVPFGKTSAAVLVLSNGGYAMDACYTAGSAAVVFTCGGVPLTDGLRFVYQARLLG